jgi:hypothetical protein
MKSKAKAYDPFPKTGKVKEYEPFIRKLVGEFCKQYPLVQREHALIEAVKLAMEFESSKWDPSLGHDFSTPLRWHLKGLKRILVDRERAHSSRPQAQCPEASPHIGKTRSRAA